MAGEALTKAYESAYADKAQTPSGMSKLDQALMEANTARQQEVNERLAAVSTDDLMYDTLTPRLITSLTDLTEALERDMLFLRNTANQGLEITDPLAGLNKSLSAEAAANQGQKLDSDKPDMSLLSPIALVLLTKVLDFGAKKYAKHNWRKGISEDRLVAASLRHITAILGGEVCDRETGLPHAAHLMCEAMFLCEQYTSQAGAPVSYQYSEAQLDLLADLLAGKPYEI